MTAFETPCTGNESLGVALSEWDARGGVLACVNLAVCVCKSMSFGRLSEVTHGM